MVCYFACIFMVKFIHCSEDDVMGVNPALVLHIASLIILTTFMIEVRVLKTLSRVIINNCVCVRSDYFEADSLSFEVLYA